MITVEQASEIICGNLFTPRVAPIGLPDAVGCILGEPVVADRDLPPFDRVSMDGIAINFEVWKSGARAFRIEATQAAGEPPRSLANAASCLEVMTGAVLPIGCDTVIRYEDIRIDGGRAIAEAQAIQKGQFIHGRGMDAKQGALMLGRGQLLAPSEIAVLASVGKATVEVLQFPRFAIVSTGDELVGIGESPEPWQLRQSNAHALAAALREMGATANRFHLRDDRSEMKAGLDAILGDHDVLILSGGVSMGKFDFVPQMLESAGVNKLFHRVSQRPGKPFWFGAGQGKVAFALPGNPVSTFMCFYKYIRPWILKSMELPAEECYAVLEGDYSFPPPLTCFLQVSVANRGGALIASPVPGAGSGDFVNLRNADGFLELPMDQADFRAGEVFRLIPFRR